MSANYNPRSVDWVNVRDLGAKGDGSNDDTVAWQAALDSGLMVYAPEPKVCYALTDTLLKRSIGQEVLGDGPNRTILRQTTSGKGIFQLINPATTIQQWRGLYNGGVGVFLHKIRMLTLETSNQNDGSSVAIKVDGGDNFIGDWLFVEDVLTYGFQTHYYVDSLAHFHIKNCYLKNASSKASSYGTGIQIPPTSANPNSHIFDGVSISGFAIGANLYCLGAEMNFGDVGECVTGLQFMGSGSLTGGHFEDCTTPLRVGALINAVGYAGNLDVSGVDMLVDPAGTAPIVLNYGSLITGDIIGGANSVPLVQLNQESDKADLKVYTNAGDSGLSSPQALQFLTSSGKARRFPTFLQLLQDNRIPAFTRGDFTTVSGNSTVTTGSTQGMVAGMTITGTNLAGGTTIASIPDATHLVLSANASASGAGQQLQIASLPVTSPSFSGQLAIVINGNGLGNGRIIFGNEDASGIVSWSDMLNITITTGTNNFSGTNTFSSVVNMTNLPTSDPHVAGRLWSNLGIVTVSAG